MRYRLRRATWIRLAIQADRNIGWWRSFGRSEPRWYRLPRKMKKALRKRVRVIQDVDSPRNFGIFVE